MWGGFDVLRCYLFCLFLLLDARGRGTPPRPGAQATVAHAMIAQLRKPAAELKEAVELHFRLRKRAIIATVRAWASDAANSAQHTKNLERLEKELCKELNKLG